MGDEVRALRPAAVVKKWLEDLRVGYDGAATTTGNHDLSSLVLAGARVSVAEPGRIVCSLRVRAPLADAEGRWHAGVIAAAADILCSVVLFTVEGAPAATVHCAMSYFSPAHHNEEVEMEGRVVSRKGKLTAAAVEVRKEESGELVAVGKQWMTSAWPTKTNTSSKL